MEGIHSIIRMTFYFTVRNNKFNIINDSVIYYNLDYYANNDGDEGRICLFNSHLLVEEIEEFHNSYLPFQVATTQNKVNSYARYFE